MKKIMKQFLPNFKALLTGLFLLIAGMAFSQVQLQVSGTSNVSTITTGNQFIYTLNYSVSSLTSVGHGIVATIVLPANVTPVNTSPFSSSIDFDPSQVTGATYTAGTNTITVTFVDPFVAGSTGQLQIKLKYPNGVTPNGYAPNIFTSIDATNNLNPDGSTGPVNSDTINVVAIASNKFTVSKDLHAGGAINDLSIFKININSNSGSTGGLYLKNPVVVDTLPTGVVFVEATPFAGSNNPVYNSTNNTVTWTWPSGATSSPAVDVNYGSSAYISVKYTSPTYSVGGASACNYATLSGTIPTLPIGIGADSAVSNRNGTCNAVQSPTPGASCNGGGISAATAWWLDHHILAGTSCNWFSEGWYNSGNTQLDRVEMTYTVDKSIDMHTIRIRPVYDGFDSAAPALITVSYTTNLHSGFTTLGAYQSLDIANNIIPDNYTPTLAANEYLIQVKFVVTGTLPIGGYEDFSYCGDARTAALGAKDGSTITEGTTYDPSHVGDDGTTVTNHSAGTFTYNSTTTSYSSCDNTVEILSPRPVFGYSSKSFQNSDGNYKASDTVQYQFHTYLGGNVNAAGVVVTDTLNKKLSYVPGSSTFISGSTSVAIAPDTTRTSDGRMILNYHLGTLATGADYYINFNAVIAPGTAPTAIFNKMSFTSTTTNVLFTGTTDSVSVTVISAVALRVKKGQTPNCGNNVSQYYYYPTIAHTIPGGPVNYKITISNLGNVVANNFVMIDAFPFIGDYRGSQWFANMVAPPVVNDPSGNSTLYYTTTSNPCYPDLSPAINPAGCNNPTWSTTPPADITQMTAIKLSRPADLNVFDSVDITWSMRAPVGVPFGYEMNNSVSYQVSRADNGVQLLPATPNQVGMVADCISTLGSIGNYAWLDTNKNGLQDEPANLGLNGVKVYLYSPGADGVIGGGDDILLDSSITGYDFSGHPGYYLFPNLTDGKYYVNFPTVYNQNFITKTVNQTDKTDGNSDVNITTGNSEVVTIIAANGGNDKDNMTIDAGYYPTGTLGNYVWFDANADGLQNDGSSNGLNGVKVLLLKDDGTGNFVQIDDTLSANDANGNPGYYNFLIQSSGNYIVNFPTTNNTTDIITTRTVTAGTDGNSDADGGTGNSPIVVMNVYNNGHSGIPKNNPTIDCGYHCTTDAGVDQTTCSGTIVTLTGTRPTTGTWHALGSNPTGTTLGSTSGGIASLNIPLGVSGTFKFIYQSGYCTDTMDVIVIAKSNAGPDQQICGGKIATLTGTAPSNGTWSAQTGNPVGATLSTTTGGVALVSFTDVATGNFNFIYTSPTGCTDTMTVAVTPKPIAGADQAVCAGNTVQLSGLVLPTGTWSSMTGNLTGGTLSSTTAGVATSSFTPTSLGDYFYIYTSTFCTDTMKVSVVQPMADILLASGSHAQICVGNTTTLTDATAGGTWTSSNTAVATVNGSTGVVTGISNGYAVISYTVTSTTICGCNIKTFTVTVNSTPVLQPILGGSNVCIGSMITVTDASGGGNWSTSNNLVVTVNSSGNVYGVSTGTATIYYTATNGCGSDIKSTDITVCQPIAPIVGNTTLCVGGSSTLTDATPSGNWSSSDNTVATVSSTGVVNAVAVGNAIITYTPPTGTSCCANSVSANVSVSNAPALAPVAGPGAVCTGQMITLTDASGGGSWSTSDNTIATVNTSGNVTGVSIGSVSITYTTNNACGHTSQSATVVVGGVAISNNTGNTNICVGSTSTLSNGTAGGTWSSSDNTVATVDNSGLVTGIAAGNATITYSVASGSVCGSNTSTSTVYVNNTPTLAPIMGGGVVCIGSYITLMDPSGGGNWSSSDNTIATVNSSGNVFGVSAGSATITYTANYYCGSVLYTLTQTATVYPQGALANITGNTNLCLGTTSTLSNVTAGGTWSSSNNSVATVDNFGVVTSVSTGNVTISYTVASGSVCGSNVANAYVVVSSSPSIAPFVGTTTICANTGTTLMCPSGGGNWSSSDNSVATINSSGNVFAVSAGTTTITYTANTTCGNATRNVTFTVLALPTTPTISGSLVVCNGANTVLTSSYATGNQWYNDGVAIAGANGQTLTVSTPGSYTVASNNSGTCNSLQSSAAVVNTGVVYGFSINVNPQALGGNNFIFTSATPTTHNTYLWDFGDGTTTTVINPSRTYASSDTYAVKQIVTNTTNGCIDSTTQLAIVVGCCVTSGSTGGTESKSLGNVISQRFYTRVTNSINDKVDYTHLNRIFSVPAVQVMGFGNVTLQSLLPNENSVSSIMGGTINVYPTSPTDLVDITNALEVQAQDYTMNSNCKAVVFATKTSNMIYAHTKPVCDRLREAVLQDIQNVTIRNTTMIQYKLLQNTGEVEYAISFSAGKNANSSFYEIQSKWLNEDYTGSDTMFNFQVWGVNPQVVASMVTNILSNLNNNLPYYQFTYAPVPQTYIMSHKRNQTSLDITINNKTTSTSANLYVTDYLNELSTALPYRIVPVTINPNGKTVVSVDMSDKYQADVKMYDATNTVVNDEIYSNDGPWDISYDSATTVINQFSIANDGIAPANNEWRLFRNLTVNATTSSYVSVFKLMKAASLPRDISAYNGLKFTANASGATSLKITFVKNSIIDWNSQYSITIPTKQGTQDYMINYSDLVSAGLGAIDASDVTAITISFMVNSGTSTALNATITNAKLVNNTITVIPTVNTKLGIYPNPVVNSSFTCSFNSLKAEALVLKVIETGSGKVVYTETVNSVAGQNTVLIKLNNSLITANNYVVTLEGESTKYDIQNIVVNKK